MSNTIACTLQVPTYNPNVTDIADEHAPPLASIDIADAAGLMAVLRAPGIEPGAKDCPNIQIERRAHGWAVFIHLDDSDTIGMIFMPDDKRDAILFRDRFGVRLECPEPGTEYERAIAIVDEESPADE